jgi:uncharacterized protein (DUF1501 family)
MRRRDLLALTAAAALAPLAAPALAAAPQTAGAPKRLVVVLLRGAVDGLNVVIPYADEAYYAARPTIAVQRPEAGEGAGLALDDHFALHPALAALMPLWRERQLAFVHAAGSSDPTRSHFDAQLFVENGTPGRHATADGWMNRLLAALPGPRGPTDAIAIGPTLPAILRGPLTVANLPLGQAAGHQLAIDRPEIASAFDRLYAGGGPLGRAYREGRAARAELLGQIGPEPQAADGGSLPANGFPAQAARLAHLLSRNRRTRLAFVALDGWDTHVRQGGAQGQLAERLQPLGDGLAALAHGLGSDWNDTVVIVMSEFGRTVRRTAMAAPTRATATRYGAGGKRAWRPRLRRMARPFACTALRRPRSRRHHRFPLGARFGRRAPLAPFRPRHCCGLPQVCRPPGPKLPVSWAKSALPLF